MGSADRLPRRLTCQAVVELVTDHLEGALGAAVRQRFERHLAACAPCGVYLAQMGATLAGLRCLDGSDLPSHAGDQLAALAARRRRRSGATP